jgi:hypothetical protein
MSYSTARRLRVARVGGKRPRRCPGVVSQSQVGEAVCQFLELYGVGRTMADGWRLCHEDGRVGYMGNKGEIHLGGVKLSFSLIILIPL